MRRAYSGKNEDGGYEIFAYGFSEGTKFYRVDTGEELVTGPHVTGTEEVIVKDGAGRTVWKRAESDTSDLLYQPERDAAGKITGQEPVSRIEPQSGLSPGLPIRSDRLHRFAVRLIFLLSGPDCLRFRV